MLQRARSYCKHLLVVVLITRESTSSKEQPAMRNLTLRFMLGAAAILIVAVPFSAQAQGDSKEKAGSQQTTSAQGASCPMAGRMKGATGAPGDMLKNMPMGGDMMKNMPMGGRMMKNMPMGGDMMKNMPMGGDMMKNM